MTFVPNTPLLRVTSMVLVFYVGAFFGQTLCVLHSSHMESAMEGLAAAHASSSMVAHSPSQHDEHSGQDHSGACAVVACGSAVTASVDHGLGPRNPVLNTSVAYLGGVTAPDVRMVLPPPRLS